MYTHIQALQAEHQSAADVAKGADAAAQQLAQAHRELEVGGGTGALPALPN